ncbi:MAG: hypothetical protein U9Q81_06895, partial [Pseudomonadota bacterium]|nr:hypothetical protein [Pseudomonadota bacterium]
GVGSSEEGARMLSWSENGEIRVWDLDRGRGQMRFGTALLQALESETKANHRDPRKGGGREIEWSTKTLVSARNTEHAGAGSTSVSSYQAPRVTILDNATQQTLSPAFPESFHPDDDGAIIGPNGRHLFAWSKGKKRVLVPTGQTVSISNSRTPVSGGYRTEEVGQEEAWLWDIESGTNAVTRLTTDFRNGTFSSDGKRLLAWSTDQLQLLDSETGKRTTRGFAQESGVAGAAFSAGDHWILSWNQGGSARVWDAATGDALTAKLEHDEPIVLATFSRGPHPRRALTQTARGVSIWDIETAKSLTRSLRYPAPGRDGDGHTDGARRLPKAAASEAAGDSDGLDAFVEWASEGAWPKSKLRLKLEVETGTELGPTDEIHPLPAAEWNRKKWCDYEVVRHCIGELPDEAWRRSQLRCDALSKEQQGAETGTLRAAYDSAMDKLGFFRCP